MSCCIASRRVVSCRVVSRRVVSCRVVFVFVSCRVVSCRVVSCRVVSCRVVSCRVVSCSCRVVFVSCRAVPCRAVSCRVVSCRVVSCRVVLCCVVLRRVPVVRWRYGGGGAGGILERDKIDVDKFGNPTSYQIFPSIFFQGCDVPKCVREARVAGGVGFLRAACSVNAQRRHETQTEISATMNSPSKHNSDHPARTRQQQHHPRGSNSKGPYTTFSLHF